VEGLEIDGLDGLDGLDPDGLDPDGLRTDKSIVESLPLRLLLIAEVGPRASHFPLHPLLHLQQ